MKHYLISVWGDVEPSLRGPFDDDDARLAEARRIRRDPDADDEERTGGLFRLDIDETGEPTIDSFTGGEVDPEFDEFQDEAEFELLDEEDPDAQV